MESRISSFDSSRTSHSWTLVENEYATLLLGEEGKIDGGYFLDDIHPVFFQVRGSDRLPSGPIDFLGVIGGKTSWTVEDGLDLEYDCDLLGLGGLEDDHNQDQDHDHDHDHDVAVVGLEGSEDDVDFLGFNNILSLSRTTIGYNFVLVNGEDYVSGFVQFTGKYRPTLNFVKELEMIFAELMVFPKEKPFIFPRPPKEKPMKLKIPGKSGPDSSIPTKMRLKALSVPRRLVSLEAIRIPVLLSYSPKDGDLELYVPAIHGGVVRPPLAVNFSRYLLLSHNYRDCEFLLFSEFRREIIVYRWLDNTVVNLPYIRCFGKDWFRISGYFVKVVLGGGRSDYRVFVIAFHRSDRPVGTLLRIYYRQPFQRAWNRRRYLMAPTIQDPLAFLVIRGLFAWVDVVSGTVFTIGWLRGVPVPGPEFEFPGSFAGAQNVLSVEDEGRKCLVVHHHHVFTVYDISISRVQLPDPENHLRVQLPHPENHLAVWRCDLRWRANLSNRNFYCSASSIGFSAPPHHLGAGPINAIFVGGYAGDCSRLNNYAEIISQRNAGLEAVVVDFECLRHCHDPPDAAQPLLCLCQSAFLLLPLHLVARMIPSLVLFMRNE